MVYLRTILSLGLWLTVGHTAQAPFEVQTSSDHTTADVKVPVILGVMSQCPDAILCESVFNRALEHVADIIDLTLSFIGRYVFLGRIPQAYLTAVMLRCLRVNQSEPDFGVTCMHGPDECAGNVQELCAMKYTPTSVWWRFVQCQNHQGRYEVGKPETALKCANATGIDWKTSGVGECAGLDGSGRATEGVDLLRESVLATQRIGIQ